MFPPREDGLDHVHLTANKADGIGLHGGAGTAFEKIQTLFIGDAMVALEAPDAARAKIGKAGQWIQVATPGGAKGWVDGGGVGEVEVEAAKVSARTVFVWREGHAMAGLHGPTEAWVDRWDDEAINTVREAKIEAVKLLASNDLLVFGAPKVHELVDRLRGAGVKFILARLFSQFGERRKEEDFVNDVGPAAQALFAKGVKYFEVHNEPNLNLPHSREGMFVQWQDGAGFADFYVNVVAMLRAKYPELKDARFGYPGLSPVVPETAEPGSKYPMEKFLKESTKAVKAADFICMHVYWGGDGTAYSAALKSVEQFCAMFPDKLVLVTEFANTAAESAVGRDTKGQEYARFFTEARKLPTNLGALFSYALQSAGDYSEQVWKGSTIAASVGKRRTT